MVTRILRKAPHPTPAASAQPLNAPGAWDFFLSHGQALAGDQVKMLCFLLRQRKKPNGENYTVWYDNDMDDCSTEAMLEGVKGCGNFVLFFSGDPPVIWGRSGAPPSAAAAAAPAGANGSGCVAPRNGAAEEGIPPSPGNPAAPSQSLEGFLGTWHQAMRVELAELGAEEVSDLAELEPDEVEQLARKLKPLQARKFVKKVDSLKVGGGTEPEPEMGP